MKYIGFILLAVIIAIILLLLIAVIRTLLMPGRGTGGGIPGTGTETFQNDPV